MARFFKLCVCAFLFILSSCQEGGEAGDLWGQWRMTGSDNNYISFSGSVSLLKDTSKDAMVYGNFQHIGDSLFIQYYSAKELRVDTLAVEQSFGFKPFNNIRLKIETLDGDILVLSKEGQTWNFYKY